LSARVPRVNGKPYLSGVWQPEGAPVTELMKILPGGVNGLGEDPPATSFFNVLAAYKSEESPLRQEFVKEYEQRAAVALTEPPPAACSPLLCRSRIRSLPRLRSCKPPSSRACLSSPTLSSARSSPTARKLPEDPQPAWLGYSIGKWQGDSLVVDTIGLIPFAPLDVLDHPHSDALHVTEQFRRKDFGHMDVQATIDDSKIYTKPFTYTIPMGLLPDTDLIESFCTENEKDAAHMTRK
jgi:hypothetical protein